MTSDSGPGVSTGAAEHLFEPFFSTKEDGTGLGLAISRTIVRRASGDIQLVNPGQPGARFRVTLAPHDSDTSDGGGTPD